MTIAHGLQYVLLVAKVRLGPSIRRPTAQHVAATAATVLAGGTVLAIASHLDGGDQLARAGYGIYLGVVMTHFVVDAGLWRLRDDFPRQFLSGRLPDLLPRLRIQTLDDASAHDIPSRSWQEPAAAETAASAA